MPEELNNPVKDCLCICKDMCIAEILILVPESADIMAEYGLHCFACEFSATETLEEGCSSHGFDSKLIDELVDDINTAFESGSAKPQTLTITCEAAKNIEKISEKEGHKEEDLIVTVDEAGEFCMEFRKSDSNDLEFKNMKYPDIKVFASPLTLRRIGGSTIDFRDGAFKLDLEGGGCCGGEKCKE